MKGDELSFKKKKPQQPRYKAEAPNNRLCILSEKRGYWWRQTSTGGIPGQTEMGIQGHSSIHPKNRGMEKEPGSSVPSF